MVFGSVLITNISHISRQRVVYGSFPTSNHNTSELVIKLVMLFMGLFLHQTTTQSLIMSMVRMLFMGLFLHQTTTARRRTTHARALFMGLFLHQTTTVPILLRASTGCLWVFSYIKPQRSSAAPRRDAVVYGSFPTSNHNSISVRFLLSPLFMGLFLHQTTTFMYSDETETVLFMGLFLHQTTTMRASP